MEQTLNDQTVFLQACRNRLRRIVFFLIFISLIYSFFSNTLVSQLRGPVLIYPSTDLTYLLFHIIKLPEFISGHPAIAVVFDSLMLLSCLGCLIYPRQRFPVFLFFFLFLVYLIIYNSYGLHHTHSKIGVLLLPVPFMIRDDKGFLLLWRGLRYYTCYIFFSAFLWKLFRGSWLTPDQGLLIMKNNLTPYLFFNPQTVLSRIYSWVFQHPAIPDLLFKAGFIAEGLFVAGFFTRRADKYLFVLTILLPLGFLFVADAMFFELAFLSVTFYNWGLLSRENINRQQRPTGKNEKP
ncbi:MAG TPA: hypothetical protein VHC50_05195 [Puia sp.]|nr:hypothetical protein [Puia sp.]